MSSPCFGAPCCSMLQVLRRGEELLKKRAGVDSQKPSGGAARDHGALGPGLVTALLPGEIACCHTTSCSQIKLMVLSLPRGSCLGLGYSEPGGPGPGGAAVRTVPWHTGGQHPAGAGGSEHTYFLAGSGSRALRAWSAGLHAYGCRLSFCVTACALGTASGAASSLASLMEDSGSASPSRLLQDRRAPANVSLRSRLLGLFTKSVAAANCFPHSLTVRAAPPALFPARPAPAPAESFGGPGS